MIRREVKNFIELREAAKALSDLLEADGVTKEFAFDARLILSELAGNVIKHAQSVAFLETEILDGELRLTVYAENGSLPPEESFCPAKTAEGGRGLFLVDKLSAERIVTEDGGVRVIIKM